MNEERRQAYLNFLLQLLLAFLTGNPRAVYSLLEANPDKLDDGMVELFQSWTGVYSFIRANFYKLKVHLPTVSPDKAETLVAAIIAALCDMLVQFDREGKANNIEIAIAGYRMILNVFDRETFPKEWATTQNSLGATYRNRIQGDRAENLELSLEYYRNALEFYTPDAVPLRWADIHNNLANTYRDLANIYRDRIQKNPAVNLEQAIACCYNALSVYSRFSRWEAWARTQNNLALIYRDRIWDNPAENLEKAIECCDNALKVYTRELFPQEWATVQSNLAIMFRNRTYGEKRKNLEQAIDCSKNALQVRTREVPLAWADTQNNLGLIHRDLRQIDEAISCFQSALEIFNPNTFPLKCLMSGGNLGNTAFADQRWAKALEGYDVAIKAVEQSRIWSSNDTRRREITSEAMEVYVKAVQACINNGQPDKAIEYVERNKVRNLVELLANKELYPQRELYTNKDNYQIICNQLSQLRQEIPAKQRQLEILISGQASEPSNRFYVEKLQQDLNYLQKQQDNLLKEINQVDPSFKFTQQVEPISFSDIQSLIDERTAIIEWYLMGDQFFTFLITRQSPYPKVWQFSAKEMKALRKRTIAYLRLYYRKGSNWWRNQLEERLQNLAEILHIDEILSHIPAECNQLILIPHQGMHILPLHALPLRKGGQEGRQTIHCLLDKFSRGVRYAPSCQLLQLSQKRQRPNFSNFFAIQNPTDDLLYTNLEVETICRFFPSAQVLAKHKATEAALKVNQELPLANCHHFSCHGKFNLKSPLESALILARDEQPENGRLTLAEIFGLTLNQCRLVTLSACETGLTGLNDLSDEYISLPSGFLYAGSPSVVSSLWAVNDLSTSFLMIKFYENFSQCNQQEAGAVAIALNQAQQWLRNLTMNKFEQELERFKPQLDQILAQLRPGQRLIFKEALRQIRDHQPYPFAHPYYWAAFTATGF
jgi:CHAT domain-containing protein